MKKCICGTWFTGRKDKQFCTSACRSQHFRAQHQSLDPMADSRVPVDEQNHCILFKGQASYESVYDFTYHPNDFWDVPAKEMPFHVTYQQAVRAFLQILEEWVAVRTLRALYKELDYCRAIYCKHPDQHCDWSAASHRLYDLDKMCTYLQDAFDDIQYHSSWGRHVEHVNKAWLDQVRIRMQ